jgi:catechol 2,3-dioxygenase-like lactoylglutathione lyase family enzyme
MFDHVGLNVGDYRASRAFYEQEALPPDVLPAFVLDLDGKQRGSGVPWRGTD